MNIKDRMIIEDFRRTRGDYLELEGIVSEIIGGIVKSSGIPVMGIEHRVKEEKSLAGKLARSGDWYQKIEDLMDLLGARIILYFADDVDRIGKLIEGAFVIDRQYSSDQRAMLDPNAFGYLSLHDICSLPTDKGYPERLTKIRFEIQIRSILQHAWAQINHDMGYKSEFGVPRKVTREFARLSGLLELADEEFIRARDHINNYISETRARIMSDDAGDIPIDMVSLNEYMLHNRKIRAFLTELSEIEDSEISEVDPESYISQLAFLGIDTIGRLQEALERDRELALGLARRALTGTGLDILASNVALRFLCRAELLLGGYSEDEAVGFIKLSTSDPARAERQAKRLFSTYEKMKGIKEESENG